MAMRILLLLFFAAISVNAQAPLPKPFKPSPEVLAIINRNRTNLTFKAATVGDPTLIGRWKYPTNVVLTNFVWDLQSTTNFQVWITEQTNLGPADVFIKTTNKFRFYRMKGR